MKDRSIGFKLFVFSALIFLGTIAVLSTIFFIGNLDVDVATKVSVVGFSLASIAGSYLFYEGAKATLSLDLRLFTESIGFYTLRFPIQLMGVTSASLLFYAVYSISNTFFNVTIESYLTVIFMVASNVVIRYCLDKFKDSRSWMLQDSILLRV